MGSAVVVTWVDRTMQRRMEVLKLYKVLLRESSKFSSYNFREYALIRIKAAFRENKSITDSAVIDNQVKEGYQNLDVIKRQVLIGNMFNSEKLVIEKPTL